MKDGWEIISKPKEQNPKKILNPNLKNNIIWNLGFVVFLEIGVLDLGFQIHNPSARIHNSPLNYFTILYRLYSLMNIKDAK